MSLSCILMRLKTCGALDIHHMNKLIASTCFIIKCTWHMKCVCATQISLSLTHGFVITAGTHKYTYLLSVYTYSNDFVHLLYIKLLKIYLPILLQSWMKNIHTDKTWVVNYSLEYNYNIKRRALYSLALRVKIHKLWCSKCSHFSNLLIGTMVVASSSRNWMTAWVSGNNTIYD